LLVASHIGQRLTPSATDQKAGARAIFAAQWDLIEAPGAEAGAEAALFASVLIFTGHFLVAGGGSLLNFSALSISPLWSGNALGFCLAYALDFRGGGLLCRHCSLFRSFLADVLEYRGKRRKRGGQPHMNSGKTFRTSTASYVWCVQSMVTICMRNAPSEPASTANPPSETPTPKALRDRAAKLPADSVVLQPIEVVGPRVHHLFQA
jgi:hypothetical protein